MPELAERWNGGDEVSLLGALLDLATSGHPGWHADALCKERPAVNFFPERGEPVGPALEACAACLVRVECGSWACAQGPELRGVWGGLSYDRRRRLGFPGWDGPADPAAVEAAIQALPPPAAAVGAGLCDGCGREVPGTAADRLRSGLCAACAVAWRRWLAAGKPDDRHAFADRRRRWGRPGCHPPG